MNTKRILAAATFLSAAALGATAQDSVSNSAGMPGDALDPYSTTEQQNDYVVDMASLITSWGTEFGIAPIVKSSQSDPLFFNNFMGANGISPTVLTQKLTPRTSYEFWNTAGAGVNPGQNDPTTPMTPPASGTQFAVSFGEAGANGVQHIVTALVTYNHTNPGRLFVSRIQAATDGSGPSENLASIYAGSVDADGNAYIRGDDFGVGSGNIITGDNIYRVNALARNTSVLNVIDGSGLSDTGDWLVQSATDVHTVPSRIPADVAGRPVLLDANFISEYVYESAPNVLSTTTTHLGGSPDHRGPIGFSIAQAFPNTVGTCAVLGKDVAFDTRALLLWGVDANGAVSGTLNIGQPSSLTDNSDGYVFPATGEDIGEYQLYRSQVSFQGSNGPIAIGKDQAGRILASTIMISDDATTPQWAYPADQANPVNGVAVWRFNPANPGGTMVNTLVAYNDVNGAGKQILDGPGGSSIGQCTRMDFVSGTVIGPSFSAPMIDSVGNVWVIAAVELYGAGGSDFDTALLRGVYDPASFSYELELVLQLGDTFKGLNSNTNYAVTFMGIADSDSISSSTAWSNNMVQQSFNDYNVSNLSTDDPYTLGGLAITAEITYDYDGDGMYDPSAGSDQDYTVLLYIGPNKPRFTSTTTAYCTAGVSANGCQTNLSTTGIASSTAASGFIISGPSSEGAKTGLFYWGFAEKNPATLVGNSSSYQCVLPPVKRSQLLNGGGSNGNCDGVFTLDLNERWETQPAQNPGAGATLYGQIWYRDPSNTSNQTTSRSDAIKFDVVN